MIGCAESHRKRDPVTAGVLTWLINDGGVPEDDDLITTVWIQNYFFNGC